MHIEFVQAADYPSMAHSIQRELSSALDTSSELIDLGRSSFLCDGIESGVHKKDNQIPDPRVTPPGLWAGSRRSVVCAL